MSLFRSVLTAFLAATLIAPAFAETKVDKEKNSSGIIQISQNADGQTKASIVADQPAEQAAEKAASTSPSIAVNLNKADAKDLAKVKGLNPAKARAIVAYRKKNGDFHSLNDLAKVKGFKRMKPEKMKEIQAQLTLGA